MTTTLEPFVSIVSPVYNGECYLRECIESVLAQTYTHWDYTIVNNCSSDRTLEIAAEYAAKDPRIRVYSNENFVRVIENYNRAFRQISNQSKYCKVVAGDDWLYPECIEKMVRIGEEYPSVSIVGAYTCRGTSVVWGGLPYTTRVVSGRKLCRDYLMGGRYIFGTPTSVLYRSDIIRRRYAFYNESNLHADSEACLEFLENSDFGFVHQILSFSRVRDGSLTSFSQSHNTYLPYGLYILMKYGPQYLGEKELKRRLREKFGDYYGYLGAEIFKRRGANFWKFHKEKLSELGHPLNKLRLGVAAFAYGLDLVLNPKSTLEKVTRRIYRKLFNNS